MSQIPTNLKKIRKLHNMTQEEFSSKMSVTINMQKSYESGKAGPDILYLAKLERITGFSTKELIEMDIPAEALSTGITRIRKAEKVEIGELLPTLAAEPELLLHKKALNPYADDYKDKMITLLERENARLQRDLDLSLGELRHNMLLARAIAEVNQELLCELLAGKSKREYENRLDTASIKNGERYKKLKEEGNFAYVGK